MQAVLEESTLVNFFTAMGGGVPETAWMLVPDLDDEQPMIDELDELLELRCSSL